MADMEKELDNGLTERIEWECLNLGEAKKRICDRLTGPSQWTALLIELSYSLEIKKKKS